jgi:tetratricopeptide (TPR) repeat protein
MIRRGVTLVPFNVDYHVILGYALYNTRRFGDAEDEFKRASELDPSGAMAPWNLARLYTVQRREEEATAAYLAALRLMLVPDRAPAAIDALEAEYRRRGWDGFARKLLELAEEGLSPTAKIWRTNSVRGSSPGEMAWRYLRLGETDRAIAALEAAYATREGSLVCIKADPRFDSLHADPRFQDLVRRVGIPP